jgi:hypothetical protein
MCCVCSLLFACQWKANEAKSILLVPMVLMVLELFGFLLLRYKHIYPRPLTLLPQNLCWKSAFSKPDLDCDSCCIWAVVGRISTRGLVGQE